MARQQKLVNDTKHMMILGESELEAEEIKYTLSRVLGIDRRMEGRTKDWTESCIRRRHYPDKY